MSSNFTFNTLNSAQGLKSSDKYYFFRDTQGILWLGTDNGLALFDGQQVHYFNHQPDAPNSLPENKVSSACLEDQRGDLWFSTRHHLVCYRRARQEFEYLQAPLDKQYDYHAFHLGVDGKIWLQIGTGASGALWIFDPTTSSFQQSVPLPGQQAIVLQDSLGQVTHIVSYDLPSEPGLYLIDLLKQEQQYITFDFDTAQNKRKLSSPIRSCWPDAQGGFWVGAYNGIGYCTPGQASYAVELRRKSSVEEDFGMVWGIVSTSVEELFLTTDKGLVTFDLIQNRFTRQYRYHQDLPHTFRTTEMNNIYLDPQQRLWLASANTEIVYSNLAQCKFDYLSSSLGQKIVAIAQDPNGHIWYSTANDGVYSYNQQKELQQRLARLNNAARTRSDFPMPALRYFIADGEYWWANLSNNFIFWNKQDRRFDFKLAYFLDFNGNVAEKISQCLRLHDGDYLVVKHDKVLRLHLSPEKVDTSQWYDLAYLQLGVIKHLWQDQGGRFYVNSENGDLLIFEEQAGTLVPKARHHQVGQCYAFTNDTQRQVIWVATSNGLGLIQPPSSGYSLLTPDTDQLPREAYYNVHLDEQGDLWLPANQGLIHYQPEQKHFHRFGTADGLLANSFRPNTSIYIAAQNELWLGTDKGINIIRPAQIAFSTDQPAIFLSQLLINDQPATKTVGNINTLGSLHQDYIENTLSFRFTALDYSTPNSNDYYYQLEGYDENRVYAGTNNFVRYPNLPADQYTFKVWTTNSDGVLNPSPKTLAVVIKPPIYQRWWFYLLCLLVITALLYAIFRYRLAQALKVERLRVKISSDLHDDVGGMLSGLAMQSELLELTATEADKTQLSRIAELSRSAMSRMRDTVWAIDARKDQFKNLIDRMHEHAEETLDTRGIQYAINTNTIDLEYTLATDVRQNLYLIYKEAITNVAKHSNGDTVNITLQQTNGNFTMTIHDNGKVQHKDYVTTGLGLNNMRMRAAAIQARLELQTTNGFEVIIWRDKL